MRYLICITDRECWDSFSRGKRWRRLLFMRFGLLVMQTVKPQHCCQGIDPQHKRFKVAYDFRKTVLR